MDREALMGYTPHGCKELDTTEQLTHTHTHTHTRCFTVGYGSYPLGNVAWYGTGVCRYVCV